MLGRLGKDGINVRARKHTGKVGGKEVGSQRERMQFNRLRQVRQTTTEPDECDENGAKKSEPGGIPCHDNSTLRMNHFDFCSCDS